MSSAGQIVGGIVGAVVGFYVGGPAGALQGAAIGAGLGGYLDPPKGPTVSGPRLTDLAVQTSTYGNHIPRVHAKIGIHGNIVWLENNKLKEKVRKKSSGGKGGSSTTTVKTYTYSATFILMLCEGQIAGIQRIWCQDKLIYNAGSDDIETIIASNKRAEGWTLYRGTDDQEADPRYQADVGVANASAFRGTAYIAFYDFELADYSNTLQAAQFKVEVAKLIDHKTPQLMSSVAMPEPVQTLASSCMYFSGSGAGALYKKRAGNIVGRYKVPVGQAASYRGDVYTATDIGLINGWSDEDCSAVSVGTTGFAVFDNDALQISEWALPEAYYHYIKLYRLNGVEYVVRIAGSGLSANTTQVLSKETSPLYVIPDLLSTTNLASPYGRIFDIYPVGDVIYAVTYSKQILCMDQQCNVIWSVDMSSQSLSFSHPYVADGTRLRTDNAGYIYVKYLGNFWVVDQDGFQFLGSCGNTLAQNQGLGADAVVGGVWLSYSSSSNTMFSVKLRPIETELQDLAEVIADEVALSSLLTASDIDTSLIVSQVRGYRVQGGSIRSALEPLQGSWPFDVIPSGYKVKFVPRGQVSAATVPVGDLGATDAASVEKLITQVREMDSQLPVTTNIKYLDAAREYAISEQRSSRSRTEAINLVDRELPIVLTANEGARVAEVLNFLPWLERLEVSFSLPPTYLRYEPADVLTIDAGYAVLELRLTEVNYLPEGRLKCSARPNRASLYDSEASGGEGVAPGGEVLLPGESNFIALDIPVVDETLQNSPGFVGAMFGDNSNWPGGIVLRSADQGQTWSDLQAYVGAGTVGIVLGALPSSNCTLVDQRFITISMLSGEVESITRDQMLAGRNYAAYGLNGRWELVRFQNASLQGDGTYLVSGFVRGERGTEWATGLHADGDLFVLLDDPDLAFIGMPVETIGFEMSYRAVTSGGSVDEADSVHFAYRGVNLECLSPVYAKGARDGAGNFSGTFTRRSRLSSSWWANGVQAPVGETSETYEVDVMSGATVKRTITSTTPSFTYSAADQVVDFGSTQASIIFRLYQLSSVVGRGYPLEVTL
jgi:hypothetical protein